MTKVIFKNGTMALALLLSAGCTKSLPYKEETKLEVLNKGTIDTKSEYIYSSSMSKGSRTAEDSFPYFFGENKRVKMRFTKDSLVVEETERDVRYQGNETNNKTVLEIPIEHIDYKCTEDRKGVCTNQEQVNNDIDWSAKTNFKIKPEDLKAGQFELLPILMQRDEGLGFCYQEISSHIVGTPEITSDAINFEVERTFKQNINCLSGRNLSDTNIKARFHYSMLKTSAALSKDFVVKTYPKEDENTFGFFNTERFDRDTDNNETQSGRVAIMNHWNPNRDVIDYYLSDEFAKPENANVKALTYKTFDNLNKGLAKAQAKFRLKLHEPAGKTPGDIRNSMIVLVEDPSAASVIGYGPQTEDPVTGEIISARTAMYLGTIKQFVKYTYEDLVRTKKRENAKALADKGQASRSGITASQKKSILSFAQKGLNKSKNVEKQKIANLISQNMTYNSKLSSGSKVFSKSSFSNERLGQIKGYLKNYTLNSDPSFEKLLNERRELVGNPLHNVALDKTESPKLTDFDNLEKRYTYLRDVKNCAYAPPLDVISTSVGDKLIAQLPGDLKPWEDLSASEKQKVIDIILPEIWVPTLIHEVGHNLGLRHNFEGSEDKENFYNDSELAAVGEDKKPVSNTVMEYIDDLKALNHLGKYDIAALRYAYKGEVEVVNSTGAQFVPVKTTLDDLVNKEKVTLKKYGYCTDEHVGINAGCRRFDFGTSYTEITKNLIQQYKDAYTLRNLRRDRADFSLFDDTKYASRIGSVFYDLRLMLEVAERIKYKFNLNYDDPQWAQSEFLKDLLDAAKLSGEFLISVLETQEKLCVFGAKNDLKADPQIINLDTLSKITGQDEMDCKTAELPASIAAEYELIAEAGKSFQSKKDKNSPNNYADQIDLRGNWIDKLQALRFLLYRQVGVSNLDTHGDNYADLPELRERLQTVLVGSTLNNLKANVDIEFVDGTVMSTPMQIDTFESQKIAKPIHPYIARRLGINFAEDYFTHYLTNFTAREMVNHVDKENSEKSFADAFKVVSYDPRKQIGSVNKKIYSVVDVGSERFVAAKENLVAQGLILDVATTKANIALVKSLNKDITASLLATLLLQDKSQMPANEQAMLALVEKNIKRALTDSEKSQIQKALKIDAAFFVDAATKSEDQILNDNESVKILRMLPN